MLELKMKCLLCCLFYMDKYTILDPQESVMNSSKFTEPVLTSQSETTPTLFDIKTAQKTSEQLETTYLHLQTTDKSQTTIALIPLTSDNLDVTGMLKQTMWTLIYDKGT